MLKKDDAEETKRESGWERNEKKKQETDRIMKNKKIKMVDVSIGLYR